MRATAGLLTPILVMAMLISSLALVVTPGVAIGVVNTPATVLFTLMSSGTSCPGPEVVCVPWKGMEVLFHPTWDGLEITLKGTVRYDGQVNWTWDFGDATAPVSGTVIVGDDYPYPVEARHIYNGPIGAQFEALLNVTAVTGPGAGVSSSDTYKVSIGDRTLRRAQADVAIDEGLWWLYKNQGRSTIDYVDIGYWGAAGIDKTTFDLYVQSNYPAAHAVAQAAGEAAGDAAFQNELATNWPAAQADAQAGYDAVIAAGGTVEEAAAASMLELQTNHSDAWHAADGERGRAYESAFVSELQTNYPMAYEAAMAAATITDMYAVAHTGAALESLEANNHNAAGDPKKDPYVDCVRRGLNYLTSHTEVIDISTDPTSDMNSNGLGISCYWDVEQEIYEIGMAMIALVGSATPGRLAPNGPTGVVGRTYAAIVQDMADFIAYGQSTQGGWLPKSRDPTGADNSCTQWPIIGMQAAEAKWGTMVTPHVRTALDMWLTNTQNANGGFGYSDTTQENLAKTAGTGITGLLFCGATLDDPRLQDAIAYVDAQWNTVMDPFWGDPMNFGNAYAMYGVFKGFCVEFLNMDVIPGPGTHNWWNEYCDDLVVGGAHGQLPDGHWVQAGHHSFSDGLTTAWDITILTETLCDVPPLADARANGFDSAEVDEYQSVFFDATWSVKGTYDIVLYEWDFESDGVLDATGATVTHSFAEYGDYTTTVRITDNRDVVTGGAKEAMTSTDTCRVVVHGLPSPPIADAGGPYLGQPGLPVELDGSGSWDPNEPGGDYIEVWSWDLNDDGVFGDAFGALVNHAWPAPGVYPVALMVQDSTDLWSVEASRSTVEVGNRPPVADADGPYSGMVGDVVNLDASGSYDLDEGDTIVAYRWDFNSDGNFDDAVGVNPEYRCETPGVHIIRLQVEDTYGARDTDGTMVTAEALPETWTVMLYMAADNALGDRIPWGVVPAMFEEAGYSPDVNVVGLWDGPDFGDSKVYDKTAEGVVQVDDGGGVIGPKGEVNMGDPQTLADFIGWVKANYPKRRSPIGVHKSALIIWDHGGGWRSCSFCVDSTNNDSLSIRELGSALDEATGGGSKPLQIVGFDAHLMQMLEVAYQIKGYVQYSVGSEEVEPQTSWPYVSILTALAGNPAMTPQQASCMIVDAYADAYIYRTTDPLSWATLSANDLSMIDPIKAAVDDLAAELLAFGVGIYDEEIANARGNARTFGDSGLSNSASGGVDLHALARLLADSLPATGIADKAIAVMNAVDSAVIARAPYEANADAQGIAIYYPDVTGRKEHGQRYQIMPEGSQITPDFPDDEGTIQLMVYEPCYDQATDFSVDSPWTDYLKLAPRLVEKGILAMYVPDVLLLAHVFEDPVISFRGMGMYAIPDALADGFRLVGDSLAIHVSPKGAIDIGMVAMFYGKTDLDEADVLRTQVVGVSRWKGGQWVLEKLTLNLPSWDHDMAGMLSGLFQSVEGFVAEGTAARLSAISSGLAVLASMAGEGIKDQCGTCHDCAGAAIAVPWMDMSNVAPEVYQSAPKFPAECSDARTPIAIVATGWDAALNPIQYPQTLYQGWNTISLPVIPLDSDVETLLSGHEGLVEGISNSVDVIWQYDATTGEWHAYSPAAPQASDLTDLIDGVGYLVKMLEDATLTLIGCNLLAGPYTPPEYHLVEGWNLIGYKGILPMSARGEWYVETWYDGYTGEYQSEEWYLGGYLEEDKVLFNRLQGYDRVADTLYTGDFLYPNDGYWVYVTEPGSIPGLNDENWVAASLASEKYGFDEWLERTLMWIDRWMMIDAELALRLGWNRSWYEGWVLAPSLI